MEQFALQRAQHITRRHFVNQSGALGIGSLALAEILSGKVASAGVTLPDKTNPLTPRSAPAAAKAKRVIFLHMSGGPPHLDMFDYKPELVKHNDEPCPDSMLKGKTFAFTSGVPKLLGTAQTWSLQG